MIVGDIFSAGLRVKKDEEAIVISEYKKYRYKINVTGWISLKSGSFDISDD